MAGESVHESAPLVWPTPLRVGILHPGNMGAALGAALVSAGHQVMWASQGRSPATSARAAAAGFRDAVTVADLVADADLLISICPPHAALETAASIGDFAGVFVDANAISPATSSSVGELITRHGGRFVDAAVIGGTPRTRGETRLYVSGEHADALAALFDDSLFECRQVEGEAGRASALKMAYAGWTKGSTALLLAVSEYADHAGVGEALRAEWQISQPALESTLQRADRVAAERGWRWKGEMEEIARALAAADLPPGFHQAAAEMFGRRPRPTE